MQINIVTIEFTSIRCQRGRFFVDIVEGMDGSAGNIFCGIN